MSSIGNLSNYNPKTQFVSGNMKEDGDLGVHGLIDEESLRDLI
jgi:hypothetical protein